tara:strand:- start:1265 stop:1483 length:219 start_codon:yes stop_codon:yes gene_type:complete
MERTEQLAKNKMRDMLDLLKTKDFKEEFIDAVNDDIDIPLMREKTEGKIFKKIYDIMLKQVEKAVKNLEKVE